MTADTSFRSSGAAVSRSIMEAITSTSYGVSPRRFAARRSTVRQRWVNAAN